MLQTRIVPWINYEEFETVYKWLFADRKTQLDQVNLGIDRVCVLSFFLFLFIFNGLSPNQINIVIGSNME